jgi:hypothetical protein
LVGDNACESASYILRRKNVDFSFRGATAINIINRKRETSFTVIILFEDANIVLTMEEMSSFFRPAPQRL